MQRATVQLGPDYRSEALCRLATEEHDLLVIGGGATGVGVALDAATRGLSVALVESRDIAAGTSSRSSKLVHGGLRYLEQLEFSLVREALRERQLLLHTLAPHLVEPVSFVYPLRHRGWERPYVGAGVLLYDLLGGARALPAHRHLTRAGVLDLAPAVRADSMVGGIRYWDGKMDDARLALAIARTAADHGALITTGTTVVGARTDPDGRVREVEARDEETGEVIPVRASAVAVCAGVWTPRVAAALGSPRPDALRVTASKGVHLVVPRSAIDAGTGLILRTEKSVLFVIPWGEHWVVGTTDTPWRGQLEEPAATATDVRYVLDQANRVLRRPLEQADVVAVYAGLRPLVDLSGAGDETTKISREHAIGRLAPNVHAIAGGKWTTYRVMARDLVDAVVAAGLPTPAGPSRTALTPLAGATDVEVLAAQLSVRAGQWGVDPGTAARLARRYGTLATELLDLVAAEPVLGRPLRCAPHLLVAEVVHAARAEGARTLEDVLDRRLRVSLHMSDPDGPLAEEVAAVLSDVLGWNGRRRAEEVASYRARVQAFRAGQQLALDDEADAVMLGTSRVA